MPLQGIFPTQGPNPALLYCRWILYCLSHQRSPRILEFIPSPGDFPEPGIQLVSPALQVDSLPADIPGKVSHSRKRKEGLDRRFNLMFTTKIKIYLKILSSISVNVPYFTPDAHAGRAATIFEYLFATCTVIMYATSNVIL